MFSLLACLVLDQSSLKDFSKSCDNYPDTGGTRAYTELGIGLIALATTSGTLVCCALPVLLVTLGMGVVVSRFWSCSRITSWNCLRSQPD